MSFAVPVADIGLHAGQPLRASSTASSDSSVPPNSSTALILLLGRPQLIGAGNRDGIQPARRVVRIPQPGRSLMSEPVPP